MQEVRIMKAVITILVAGVVAAGASFLVNEASVPSAHAGYGHGRQVTATQFDDLWDTGNAARRVCRYNKRKCVEIASGIAYNMARSGAYADLNDDQFAQLATRIAAHIVDSDYNHDETDPLDP